MGSGAEQRAAIDTFSAALPVMPDAERERLLFGTVFIEHIDYLWPQSEPAAMPDWIRAHAFDILAALEQMLGRHPSVRRLPHRLHWLLWLLANLDQPAVSLDG